MSVSKGLIEELQMDMDAFEQPITKLLHNQYNKLSNNIKDIIHVRIPNDMCYIRASTQKMDGLVNGILNLSQVGLVALH